jgi:formamidopyrimidine-DNA glycosylase
VRSETGSSSGSGSLPELPEVETLRRELEPRLRGRVIRSLSTFPSRVFQLDPAVLEAAVTGQTIHAVSRRAKYLIFELDRWYWIIHLGMTGQLTVLDEPMENNGSSSSGRDAHLALVARLSRGRTLWFRDVRKFGRVMLFSREGDGLGSRLGPLGPEPLGSDYLLEGFLGKLAKRKARIKSLLLDQKVVAGVGNIYADEALFEAGVHPARRVRYIRRWEKVKLFESIPRVLKRAVLHGGTTLQDYRRSNGDLGEYQSLLKVYGRDGQPCTQCGSIIQKTVISQRGSHFCACCQPRKPRPRPVARGCIQEEGRE